MERTYESAAALAHCAVGPLANHLDEFVASLTDQQYVPAVVYVKALHALAFDRWLAKRRVTLADLGEIHIERFARRRRRQHQCIRAETRRRERYDVSEALQFLRARGMCKTAGIDPAPAEVFVVGFEQHLRHHQGLTPATIETYSRFAAQFLHERFGTGAINLRLLRPGDPIEFVQDRAKRMRPPALKCVVNALRSLLRYGQYRGEVAPELVAAVPAVADLGHHAALAKAISAEHAQRAIDSCDLQSAIGLRDRAVLLLLARLGLRAHEIIALRLEDCDWDAGACACAARVGASASYRCPSMLARPSPRICNEDGRRALIGICSCAAWHRSAAFCPAPMASARSCATRCGEPRSTRRILARISSATPWPFACCERGASLAEIGEVLRHRSPQTTSIYARVDIGSLRSLALAWPGGAR